FHPAGRDVWLVALHTPKAAWSDPVRLALQSRRWGLGFSPSPLKPPHYAGSLSPNPLPPSSPHPPNESPPQSAAPGPSSPAWDVTRASSSQFRADARR